MPTFSKLMHHTEQSWQYDRDKQHPAAFTTAQDALDAAGIVPDFCETDDVAARLRAEEVTRP